MGSYVESVVGSGETVEYQASVSIWSMVPLFLLGLVLLPLFGIGLIFWVIAVLRYLTTELAVTNKKIIAKFGFISRNTIELLLPKVESIQVNQGIVGRICNFGSIVVSGAGNPQAPVPGIADPMAFRKRFMEIQEKTTNSAST
ncbi:MAG: PH domain-containing protein [Gammaproteobacteria bacterium]|nr:PH domain-containing protein [Gammaproteobacteria bacterium]